MALEGLRDLSVIATAPQRRLAIKTFVRNEGNGVIREAVLRELKRGGQVYFLHNEVETIENRRQKLEEILPEARIAVAHGQMPERELERVMRDFVAQRYNLLLCSTIIETGIDVPTANTIVMSRADKFGLAQLHQLRGRVGRSHHQAYAYLMVPDTEGLTKQASAAAGRDPVRWKSWAPAFTWPCTTWKSAAPARCWARTRAATCSKWASSSTTRCWPRPCAA
jgi:transcription-repair coupling factor (superfamily II helicase)